MANGVTAEKSFSSTELERWAQYQREFWQDPVHEGANGQWYFWDETWANRHGPYPTRREAEDMLHCYCRFLEDGKCDCQASPIWQKVLFVVGLVCLYVATITSVGFLIWWFGKRFIWG